jgi:hypothetical protein
MSSYPALISHEPMRELLNAHLLEVAAAKIVPAIAGIGFIAIAARYCAAADYGEFSLAFAVSNLLSVVAVVWISQSVLRYAGSGVGVDSLRSVVAVALVCAVVLSAASLLLVQLISWPGATRFSTSAPWLVPVLAVTLALNAVATAYATALQRFRAYRIAEVARGALALLLVAGVAILQAGAAGLVLAYALGTLVPSTLLLLRLDRSSSPSPTPAPLRPLLQKFLQYGWPMTLWAALQATQSLMERNVLGGALSAADFGRFMAATDVVVRGIGLALMPVVTFVHARLMATAGQRTQLDAPARKLLRDGSQLIVLGGIGLTLAVLLARTLLAHVAPGIAAIDTVTLLMLCVTATAWALALIVHKPLELGRHTLRMSVLLAAAVAMQWVLLSTWVGTWRELAMPLASCAAAVLYMAGCLLAGRRSWQRYSDWRAIFDVTPCWCACGASSGAHLPQAPSRSRLVHGGTCPVPSCLFWD